MLKKISYSLSIIGLCLSIYVLISKKYEFSPYMLILLGVLNITLGLKDINNNNKKGSIVYFVFAIIFFIFSYISFIE